MKGWGKGILFINGANLGRYWSVGPQRTLYVPGPLLREGVNKVSVMFVCGGRWFVLAYVYEHTRLYRVGEILTCLCVGGLCLLVCVNNLYYTVCVY